MADKPDDGAAADGEGERIQSIDNLAERQERTETKLDQILSFLSPKAGGGSSDPSSSASASDAQSASAQAATVEEQVRAELARAKGEQDAADAAAASATERETVAQRLRALEEKPPAQPVRRITRIIAGWSDKR